MKILSQSLLIGIVVLASAASAATAQTADAHKIVSPQDIKWGPAPASLPPGAELAVLYGDPSKEGEFAMRLKGAKGYHIAPHTHPKPEIVTVISGTVSLGMGETADHGKAQQLLWFVLRLCADTGMPAQHDTLRDGLSFTPPC